MQSRTRSRYPNTVFAGAVLLAVLLLAAAAPQAVSTAAVVTTLGVSGPDAPVAQVLNYQGRLASPGGAPKPDGNYTIFFALYDAQTGGTLLWSETRSVAVVGGLFSLRLGEGTAFPSPTIFDGRGLWLAITVAGESEATPRLQVSYVAYAMYANRAGSAAAADSASNADRLGGQPAASYAPSAHNHWGGAWSGAGTGLTLSGGTQGLSASGSSVGVYGESPGGNGVHGFSTNGVGVRGISTNNAGVYGESASGYGGIFTSGTDQSDLMLAGAVGRINTDPANQNSDLILSSNNDVIARLDNDSGENGFFRVKNSGGTDVCTIDETGNVIAAGTVTADKVAYTAARTHYFSVGSEDFVPWASLNYVNGGGCGGAYLTTSGEALVAAVHLPHGARVTQFEVFFYDTSAGDMTVTLYGQYLTQCGYFSLAQVASSGTAGYYSVIDTPLNMPTINNTAAAYHIKAYSTAWSSTLKIKGAVITYTISEAP